MAKNDVVIVDKFISEFMETNDISDIGKGFEQYSVSELLKDFDFSNESICDGFVDGKDDGGIDYIFVLVNNHLIKSEADFSFLERECNINLIFITCKHDDTFSMNALTSLGSSLEDLLDLTKDPISSYNNYVLNKISTFKELYLKSVSFIPNLEINIYYMSRGDTSILDSNIVNKAKLIKTNIENMYSNTHCNIAFVGAAELLTYIRKIKNYNLQLPMKQYLSNEESYVALVSIYDYFKFISTSDGELAYYLFNSNVRDFMGENRVNLDIQYSLTSVKDINFWHLNNGITILCTNLFSAGNLLNIENVQIINGLQTSYSIYNYFRKNSLKNDNRQILVKILKVPQNDDIKKSIIKATNNQTVIEVASLFAIDKVQKDIEDGLLTYKIFYGRKTNYYENKGVSKSEIILPLDLARVYVALFIKRPDRAVLLKNKKLNQNEIKNSIFNEMVPISCWQYCALLFLKTNKYLEKSNYLKTNRRYFNRVYAIVCFLVTCFLYKTCLFNVKSVNINDLRKYNNLLFVNIVDSVLQFDSELERKNLSKRAYTVSLVKHYCDKYSINNYLEFSKYENKINI